MEYFSYSTTVSTRSGAYVLGRETVKRAINIHQDEAWALLEAMEMATVNGWSHVIYETNNLSMSSYLQQQSVLPPWQSMPLLRKCVNICNVNPVWSCVFVYRNCKAANALAKAARQ
ncbi:uncharacterized protein LOC113342306 [Papaver somniferum]|uniref:uncharacterized protein LOC113342306 n=1 Tax=Papaver somniferum TaxID=3469 RepID=UPI000E6FEBF7|nr:uncharacterized protein LOC113342306 [Papaver somniferum]